MKLMRMTSLSNKKVLIKAGGFATQLSLYFKDQIDGDPLWSARANAVNPQAVIETHLDFLKNGADLILTNTYQASVEGFMEHLDLNECQSIELIKKTVELAKAARNKYMQIYDSISPEDRFDNRNPLIIASIGPYGAHLHDGSEYTGSYASYVKLDDIKRWHRKRIEACVEAKVDGLAIETIPCQMEAEAVVDLLCKEFPETKFWVSFQCKDGSSVANGEQFKDAVFAVWNKIKENNCQNNLLAIGVNCINPQFVSPLFESVVKSCRPDDVPLPFVVYPNSGEKYDVNAGWTGLEDCTPLEHYIPEWISLGAKIVGGCCRTNAENVRRFRKVVNQLNL